MNETQLAARIFKYYGLTVSHLLPAQTGYRSKVYVATLRNGERICLIVYKAEPGITQRVVNANRLGDATAKAGLPARQTYDSRIVRLHEGRTQTCAALYRYLPGGTIPWEAYTMKHLKALGAGLSNLHAALAAEPRKNLPAVTDEYQLLCTDMVRYFTIPGVRLAARQKLGLELPAHLEEQFATLQAISTYPNQQPLHMDFVRGNILFQEGSADISGILDFEKAAWGTRVVEIARTLAFLLVDCKYKPGDKVRKYFLQSGYIKRGASSFGGLEYLEALLDIFLLHDFYKFLLHNPYESLADNEHFVRTRAELLQRGLLRTAGSPQSGTIAEKLLPYRMTN